MSRHGYADGEDMDPLVLGRWRGQVASAIRGRAGQAFLRELRDALDAMPDKWLVSSELESEGEYCALGCLGASRGMDLSAIDPEEPEQVADAFGIPKALACEIMYENDEAIYWGDGKDHGGRRWKWMRSWVEKHIRDGKGADA